MYHDDDYEYHYQSRLPLAPGNFPRSGRRTSFSPPITQQGVFIQDYPSPTEYAPEQEVPSYLSPRPDRPDVPSTPQPDATPQMGSSSDGRFQQQPMDHEYLLPSLATSPPRPRRPSHPDRAQMFHSPVPLDPLSSGSGSSDTHRPRGAGAAPAPPPSSSAFAHPPPLPSSPRPQSSSSRRKPVPKFIPEPPPGSPFHFRSRSREVGVPAGDEEEEENVPPQPSSSRSRSPRSPNRLSISGFEALLQRGVQPTAVPSHLHRGEADEDAEGQIIWSPRIHLGLDAEGVEAREDRLRRDRNRVSQQMLHERDLGDRAGLVAETEGEVTPRQPPRKRTTFDSNPAVIVGPSGGVEPRTPTRGGGGGGVRETGSVRRFLTPKSAKSKRSRMTSYDPQYSDRDDDEGDEQDVVVSEGPVLRRGSKRLSELPPPRGEGGEYDDDGEKSSAGSSSAKRLVQAYRGRKGSVLSKPRRSKEKLAAAGAAGAKRSPHQQHAAPMEVEVVVHDSTTGSEDEKDASAAAGWDGLSGDWEKIRRETTCRPERMNWSMVAFEGRFPRLLHLLYPFAIFAHIPMTLFLDYNLIYLLCQLALYPSLPSSALRNIATRALVDVPDIQASTGWWVAAGIYAACTAGWFFGVFLWQEIGRGLFGQWGGGGKRVEIEKVYSGAASFNLACVRSFDIFSFLWRVRLAPFLPKSVLAVADEGTRWTDGVKETLAWYRQNWPTVLLLVPRAGLSVAVLLLYSTTAYGSSDALTISRDTAYFGGNGTLTGFASGVLFANAAWAAWRLLVFSFALVGLWLVDRPSLLRPYGKRDDGLSKLYHSSRDHLTISSPLPLLDGKSAPFSPSSPSRRPSVTLATWYTRRQRRLRAAILACLGSTPLTHASPTFSPFLKSPYMFGLSPSVSGGKSALSTVRPAKPWDNEKDAVDFRRQQQLEEEDRRRANLSLRGQGTPQPVDGEAGPMMSSPRAVDSLWRSASRYVIPAPNLPTSPLISFSPATPENTAGRFEGPAPLLGQTSGVQPRRRESQAAGGAGEPGASGDLGESQLHRRVRSLPHNNDDDGLDHPAIIRFDAVSPSTIPYLASPAPAPPPFTARPSSHVVDTAPPTRSFLRPAGSDESSTTAEAFDPIRTVRPGGAGRPPLLSHFSAFSSRAPSSGVPSPAVERMLPFSRAGPQAPDMSRQSTSSSFASPMPPTFVSARTGPSLPARRPSPSPTASAWNPSSAIPAAAVLDSQLTLSAEPSPSLSERDRLSARLLDEVQRLHEAEAALAREERRIAGLRRISEATSAAETARTARTTMSTSGEGEEEDYVTAESPEDESSSSQSSGLVELAAAAAQQQPASSAAEAADVDPRRLSESSAWSQPSSVGGMSESSTLRGAVRTPDALSTRGFPSSAVQEREDEPPSLAPFRLSYGSGADGLSLSAYGSPDLAESDTVQFEGPPAVGRPE
ncbi:hypothetical protein JCM6882_007275 [Rhodosporidiobolus microsporus]